MNSLYKAKYFTKMDDGRVNCHLCPHNCVIKPGGYGVCRVRTNEAGNLYTTNYGKVTSLALDPIEKKPLANYYPGSYILSAGTFGCNLKCAFCQNWTIAHEEPKAHEITPYELAQTALELRSRGNIGVAYTYNEPSIWYEFVYDTCREVKKAGMKNVLVTNGFINEEPLRELLPFVDAMNIDVKAFTQDFYRDICKGKLEDVKRTVEISSAYCHVEVTTLVVPGLNDSEEEIDSLAGWLKSVSPDITLHLTRFFPNYKMTDRIPTPVKTLKTLEKVALRHLKNVCLGNI